MTADDLLLLALGYIAVLFLIASVSERRHIAKASSTWVYTLTLAVYCSSWTFYGAVGSMAEDPWSHTPIYLGPIVVFVLGRSLLQRLMTVGHRQRVTSIADFLGARYGKRRAVAAMVSLICLVAVLPYIALQLQALEQVWGVVSQPSRGAAERGGGALLAAIGLAIFAVLFGVRRLGGSERQHGLMHAMAIESIVKLVAFVAVAGLSAVYLFSGDMGWLTSESLVPALNGEYLAHLLVSALAILCLPRQFHVTVVELEHTDQARHVHWAMPLYLTLFMVLAVPIAIAGQQLLSVDQTISADTYVQRLPMALGTDWVSAIAFLGGISAATGMVLVATVSVAIMMTNEIVTPLLFRATMTRTRALLNLGSMLRWSRHITTVAVLMIGWWLTVTFAGRSNLADIGFLSFLGTAQLAPALLLGLYWRRVHGVAVLMGMSTGAALWIGWGVLPALSGAASGDGWWLVPVPDFALLTWTSLGVNAGLAALGSYGLNPTPLDQRQAAVFLDTSATPARLDDSLSPVRIAQLRNLVEPLLSGSAFERFWRVLETSYEQRLLPADKAPRFVMGAVEAVLANTVGATSARQLLQRLEEERQLAIDDLTAMVGEAQRTISFNRESLEAAVEHLGHGVSVVDAELRLVAWNRQYERMFDYPERFLFVGCPIERVYRFNAERGILSTSGRSLEEEITRRLDFMREGSPHQFERLMPDGRILEIKGQPLPQGGFVTTYVDVTDQRELVTQLREAHSELATRLETGEKTLSERNAELRAEVRARTAAEVAVREASQSKAHFMAATSHDLLQPINAARLLGEVLRRTPDDGRALDQMLVSLDRAQGMIEELREIARLDSGGATTTIRSVDLAIVFAQIHATFSGLAEARGLDFRARAPDVSVRIDEGVLLRLLENLVSNAVKYTRRGRVLLAARPGQRGVRVLVCDTGPGIPEGDQVRIFQEFERLDNAADASDGLGLGLALAKRYARLLDTRLDMTSTPGRGTTFSFWVPRGEGGQTTTVGTDTADARSVLLSGQILCIDNDPQLLAGLVAVVKGFGLQPLSARTGVEAAQRLQAAESAPKLVIADYHLDDGDTGVAVVNRLFDDANRPPVIIISADDSVAIREQVREAGFRFLPKPIEPGRLQTLVTALMAETSQIDSGEA